MVPGISCVFTKLKGDKVRVRHTFSRVANPFKTVIEIGRSASTELEQLLGSAVTANIPRQETQETSAPREF